jgi:L-ribulose-5-phosphate 4-epimerase
LAYFSNLIYNRGLVGSSGGNISYKLSDDKFLISPTNSCLGRLSYRDFIIIDENLNVLSKKGKPSKESSLHIAVYRKRQDVHCVIHTHSIFATIFSVKEMKIPMVTVSAKLKLVETPLVGYANPGSTELKEKVESKLYEVNDKVCSLLLCNHGVLAFGSNIEQAFNAAELVEDTAKIAYFSTFPFKSA